MIPNRHSSKVPNFGCCRPFYCYHHNTASRLAVRVSQPNGCYNGPTAAFNRAIPRAACPITTNCRHLAIRYAENPIVITTVRQTGVFRHGKTLTSHSIGDGWDGSRSRASRSRRASGRFRAKLPFTSLLKDGVSWSEGADPLYWRPSNGPCWARPQLHVRCWKPGDCHRFPVDRLPRCGLLARCEARRARVENPHQPQTSACAPHG
jgi:hypothetical protein